MKATHSLIGYDRETELEKFELPIPEPVFENVRGAVVSLDDDDPEAVGCYELTASQARKIADMVSRNNRLPNGLSFFLEAHSA